MSKADVQKRRAKALMHMNDIAAKSSQTAEDRSEFDRLEGIFDEASRELSAGEIGYEPAESPGREIQGTPNEQLSRGQSFREWQRRAAENGVTSQATEGARPQKMAYQDDEYLDAYWAQRLGNAAGQTWGRRKESRAILEDTTGSGQALSPQTFSGSVVDYIYPRTVLGRAGMSVIPMGTELYNIPVFTSPAEVAWLPEASSIGVDSNPAFSTIQLNAMGGVKWTTLISIEMARDALVNGGLNNFLVQSMSRQLQLAVDNYGFFGTAITNAGLPGLINEEGVASLGAFNNRYYTGATSGSPETPTDTTELSKIRELLANKNLDTSDTNIGLISNPSVRSTILRTNASTYGKYWDLPPDVLADGLNNRWYESANTSIFPTTETAPASTGAAPAQTGSTASSLYAGPWNMVVMGMHVDVETRVLSERYIDLGYLGLFSFARFSIRCPRPDLFYRTTSIATS
jgi:HK97 family phage major capsid protein